MYVCGFVTHEIVQSLLYIAEHIVTKARAKLNCIQSICARSFLVQS